MKTTVVREIASRITAIHNCQKSGNAEWETKHKAFLRYIEQSLLPSGSGIDCGTKIDIERSQPNRIMLHASYHHMNESGMYDGWTEHDIVVTASLAFGFDVTIRGRDRNGIKDYLSDVYQSDLQREIDTKEIHEREKLI